MNVELTIQRDKTVQFPLICEEITLSSERKGSPSTLKFKVLKDQPEKLNIQHGDPVRFKVDGENIFFGLVFSVKRDKDQILEIMAYDQLRFLKNKDTIVYENKTASELIKMIADEFRLNVGEIEDTKFKIQSRIEDNKSLFDMIQYALDVTLRNTGEMYILYDDFAELMLKSLKSMRTGVIIDEETSENFDYTTSIDKQTYNKVKVVYNNQEAGTREVYIAQHGENMNRWGVLQLYETMEEGENGKLKADVLLKLHNMRTRELTIKNALGDIKVRAGSMVITALGLGDINIQQLMLVEKCTHSFKNNEHFMNLVLRGGEFIA